MGQWDRVEWEPELAQGTEELLKGRAESEAMGRELTWLPEINPEI